MKEKIKKAFEGVTLNLVFAWVFIAMFVYVIIECICEASYVGFIVQQNMIEKWDGKLPTYGEVPTLFKSVANGK